VKGQRVVVTGLGMVTPLGGGVKQTWSQLLAGKSGIASLTDEYVARLSTQFAGRVPADVLPGFLNAKEARRMDEFIQFGLLASHEAIQNSGLDLTRIDPERAGVCVGSGIGGIESIEEQHNVLLEKGARKVSPFFVPGTITNMAAGNISLMWNLRGPNLCITTACAAGTHNIGMAARLIAMGEADVMLAGGAEKGSTYLGIAGFAAARALSSRNDDPLRASRPWDKDREGFVLGDGAGILVLESYDHAKARNASIYAELTGFGMSADAHHITAPPDDGRGAAQAMRAALKDANLAAASIGYINAHGTSTVVGDLAEVAAIKTVFGTAAKQVCISSTKSMIGHMLGAAGAVEAIISILALRDQHVPPTINLDQPDEGCDLDFVPHHARDVSIAHVLSNSFGFGGTNGCLVFSRLS
jgi:3-oxoacyl-[acyl-carrier-protein] synthase II